MAYLPTELRARLEAADRQRCSDCQTSAAISGILLTTDHVAPMVLGGATAFENLCLARYSRNQYTAAQALATDPLTGETVALYHPRQAVWGAHFGWSADGTQIEGRAAIGRATIIAVRLKHSVIVSARARRVSAGWHPPLD
jgi:hypothetical protein